MHERATSLRIINDDVASLHVIKTINYTCRYEITSTAANQIERYTDATRREFRLFSNFRFSSLTELEREEFDSRRSELHTKDEICSNQPNDC